MFGIDFEFIILGLAFVALIVISIIYVFVDGPVYDDVSNGFTEMLKFLNIVVDDNEEEDDTNGSISNNY